MADVDFASLVHHILCDRLRENGDERRYRIIFGISTRLISQLRNFIYPRRREHFTPNHLLRAVLLLIAYNAESFYCMVLAVESKKV